MNQHIKKLAVIFLIASILTSSMALGVSAFINRSQNNSKNAATDANSKGELGTNAYASGGGPDGRNLTDEVTDIFARQLVAANPQGPVRNEDGSIQLLAPTGTELSSYLAATPAADEALTPPIEESRLQVLKDFKADDVSHYLSQVVQIQSGLTSDPIWQNGLSTSTAEDPSAAAGWVFEAGKAISTARDDMYALKVPEPLVPLHKSLLAFFSTTASFSSLIGQDPVAAVALANKMDSLVTQQTNELDKAAKDIQETLPDLLSSLPPEEGSIIAEMFQVKVAHAFLGFGDIVIDPTHIAATLASWAKDFWLTYGQQIKGYALGFLKNKLIQLLQQKVVAWAKGEGVPGYVTNWLVYEADSVLSAKFGLISKERAKLCGNAATEGLYGDIIASALDVPTDDLGVRGTDETVGDAPGCPPVSTGFYQRDGTYLAENFLDSLTNNTWNDLLRLKDQSIRAAGAASQAAVHEALSGRGSLDVKKCDDGTPVDSDGRCGDGSYAQVITPGSAVQSILTKSLGSAIDIITGANNEDTYAAIVQVLENAILNALWKKGEGLFQNSGGGGNNPPPPTDTSMTAQLLWYEGQLETIISKTNLTISSYKQAVNVLQGSLNFCGEGAAAQINQLIAGFSSSISTFNTELTKSQGLLDKVHEFQKNPSAHTQAELDSQVGTQAAITAKVTQAIADSDKAQKDADDATALFQNCPAP